LVISISFYISSTDTIANTMAPKRAREKTDDTTAASSGREAKKPRKGFRVGPENLPDGPWRRKGQSLEGRNHHTIAVATY
jgi:hypothetical protein